MDNIPNKRAVKLYNAEKARLKVQKRRMPHTKIIDKQGVTLCFQPPERADNFIRLGDDVLFGNFYPHPFRQNRIFFKGIVYAGLNIPQKRFSCNIERNLKITVISAGGSRN